MPNLAPQIPATAVPASVLMASTGGGSSPPTATRQAAPPSQASSRFVFQAPAPPQPSPSPAPKRNAPDPGLARLEAHLRPVLKRVWNRSDIDDIRGNAVVAYLEARNRGQDEASAIRCGVQAADRARRPPGTRSRGVRFVSDSLPAVARAAANAGAVQPDEGNAMGIFAKLPSVPRQVAYSIIVLGATVAETAEALEMTPHRVRRQLARAKRLAAEMMTEGDRPKQGRVLKPW